MPCCINDTLYYPYKDDSQSKVVPLEIDYITLYPDSLPTINVETCYDISDGISVPSYYYFKEIGKIIFTTPEEAEEALKE